MLTSSDVILSVPVQLYIHSFLNIMCHFAETLLAVKVKSSAQEVGRWFAADGRIQ